MKSHISTANTLAMINVPAGQLNNIASKCKIRLKCWKPISAKDKTPPKREVQKKKIDAHEETIPTKHAPRIIDPFKFFIQNSPKIESP